MRACLLRLGKISPRFNQQPYSLGSVGRLLSDALQNVDLLPYLTQQPFWAIAGAPGQRPVFVERVAGKRNALDWIGCHGRSIAVRAGMVNPAAMSPFARILLIAGVLGLALSFVLIARPLLGW